MKVDGRVLAMLTVVFVSYALAALIGAIAIALGWVADTRQPGRRWYPAGRDPDPYRRGN